MSKLGVGEHVMVKTSEGRKLRGHITGIGEQSFTLRPDHQSAEQEIVYDRVLQIRKNPGAITWMAVGALIVIIILAAT